MLTVSDLGININWLRVEFKKGMIVKKFIIRITNDEVTDRMALHYVSKVVDMGMISETKKGKQYCFHTVFEGGFKVSVFKDSGTQVFHVY